LAGVELFVPQLFAADLEADGHTPETARMKVNERKKDVRRVEGSLEALGVPFVHEKVGTSASLTTAESEALLALLPPALPSRAALELSPAAGSL